MPDVQSKILPTAIPTELMSDSFLLCDNTKQLVVPLRNQYDLSGLLSSFLWSVLFGSLVVDN